MTTNPWIQWMVHKGGQGESWPPSASYHALTANNRAVDLKRSDVAMTDHDRDASRDTCQAFGVSGLPSAPYDERDGGRRNGTIQSTLAQYPSQKHVQVHQVVLRALGWADGNPDGRLPNTGASFTVPVVRTIIECIDKVYFGSTLLPRARVAFGRELDVVFVDSRGAFFMAYAYHSHTLRIDKFQMFQAPHMRLPVIHESTRYGTVLHWVVSILQHELVHLACFRTCPLSQPCKRVPDLHGPQFTRMLRNMFAKGPPDVGAPAFPTSGYITLASSPLAVLIAEKKGGGGARLSRGDQDASALNEEVRRYRRNGYEVYTLVVDTGDCVQRTGDQRKLESVRLPSRRRARSSRRAAVSGRSRRGVRVRRTRSHTPLRRRHRDARRSLK